MAEYGLLPEGLRVPTYDELVQEVIDELTPKWGKSFDFSDFDPTGQHIRVQQKGLHELWQALEAVNAAVTREGSSGTSLAANLALTGTPWPEATFSTVPLILTGVPLTTIAAASAAKSASTSSRWIIDSEAPLVGVATLPFSTFVALGARYYSTGGVYQVVDDGTTAASGALTGTGSSPITHGTAQFRWLGGGTAAADAAGRAEKTGPVVAASSDLTVIDTPIGGWQGVINLEDATPGRNAATDGEARLAGEADVYRSAGTTPDAIRQTLLDNQDITVVDLIVNTSDVTVDTVPPRAIEAIVTGGDDQFIADTLRAACAAAGIPTFGNTTVVSYDAEGNQHDIRFTRVYEMAIYADLGIEKVPNAAANPESFPEDGEDQVRAAIVAWGNALTNGRNIVSTAVSARAFGVAGVLDVSYCKLGTTPGPVTSTPITISRRQRGVFATDRITLILNDGEA
ncbi:MAG: hypothetical protein ACRCU1_00425 [Alsobacter sp.]